MRTIILILIAEEDTASFSTVPLVLVDLCKITLRGGPRCPVGGLAKWLRVAHKSDRPGV